mmetsp:Transcript_7796/g.25754  ORF Transcript_7796/g.25754 Transcript_7796/m.25754 type:complete len:233 (-) Transcript_7796:75-773(-)
MPPCSCVNFESNASLINSIRFRSFTLSRALPNTHGNSPYSSPSMSRLPSPNIGCVPEYKSKGNTGVQSKATIHAIATPYACVTVHRPTSSNCSKNTPTLPIFRLFSSSKNSLAFGTSLLSHPVGTFSEGNFSKYFCTALRRSQFVIKVWLFKGSFVIGSRNGIPACFSFSKNVSMDFRSYVFPEPATMTGSRKTHLEIGHRRHSLSSSSLSLFCCSRCCCCSRASSGSRACI